MAQKLDITLILKNAAQNLKAVTKNILIPLLILTLPLNLMDQYLMAVASDLNTEENTRLLFTIFSIVLNLAETLLVTLIVPPLIHSILNKASQPPLSGLVIKNFKFILIEFLRATGSIMVGLVMLIIPGLMRIIQYLMVPLVVLFDPQYESGQVDALEKSRELTKGNFFKIFILYVLCFIPVLGSEFLLMRWNIFVEPVGWIAALVLYIIVEIFWVLVLYLTFVRLNQRSH